jgi:hypothetical protein
MSFASMVSRRTPAADLTKKDKKGVDTNSTFC